MASAQKITAVIAAVLKVEGGYVNDPDDPGGATNFGITQSTADALGLGNVANLNHDTAVQGYVKIFHNAGIIDLPDDNTFGLVADACVNHGDAYGIDWLQTALGVKVDGDIGPLTKAAMSHASWPAVYASILAQRIRFYGQLITHHPVMAKYAAGWMNRVAGFVSPFPTWQVQP